METRSTFTGWQFVGTALVCAGVLLAANVLVAVLTRHTVSKRILADARNSRGAETVALGNSLVRSGFVADAFAAAMRRSSLGALNSGAPDSTALNMAMGASSPAEHLLLLRAALGSLPRARLLLYGYYDFQLTDLVQFKFADLIGNHDLLYFQEPEFARGYYQLSRLDSVAFEISRRFPLLSERGAVWAKVEKLRRSISQQGMPAQASNAFGRVADFTLLEAGSQREFVEHCESAKSSALNPAVREIIGEARSRNMQVAFILMPLPPRHVREFYGTPAWREYQDHLNSALAADHVSVIDASGWMPSSESFGDALHLSETGAVEFSRKLAEQCGKFGVTLRCSE